MHITRHSLRWIALLAITTSGCGQTGALYLPDRAPEEVAVPTQSDSESAENKTEERQDRRGTHEAPASDTEAPVTPPDPSGATETPQSGPGDR